MKSATIDLGAMRNVDVCTVDRSTLKDIRDVVINTSLCQEERLIDFVHQIGNPYCYTYGDMVVKIAFATDTLEDKLEHYLSTM